MKILLSAFSCAPNRGSEPGVGWEFATGLAQHHQVWVLVDIVYKKETDTYLKKHPVANLHIVYFSIAILSKHIHLLPIGFFRDLLVNFYYSLWQLMVIPFALQLHKQEKFDLAHHITWSRYWVPSGIAFLPIPFIWGPVGAAETTPIAFWRTFSLTGWLTEWIRLIARWFGELNPLLWHTASRSEIAFATTPESAIQLEKLGATQVQPLSSVAISNKFLSLFKNKPRSNQPFIFISIGRLIYWKGHHLALQALAQIQDLNWEYWIVGDGPEQKQLKQQAINLGINAKVHFFGFIENKNLPKTLEKSNVLIHLALRENGGMVVTEAMAAGKAVICLNLGGPALQVTEACGFRIDAKSPSQSIQDTANAMRQLITDENLYCEMCRAAHQRAKQHFHWQGHIDLINANYLSMLRKYE